MAGVFGKGVIGRYIAILGYIAIIISFVLRIANLPPFRNGATMLLGTQTAIMLIVMGTTFLRHGIATLMDGASYSETITRHYSAVDRSGTNYTRGFNYSKYLKFFLLAVLFLIIAVANAVVGINILLGKLAFSSFALWLIVIVLVAFSAFMLLMLLWGDDWLSKDIHNGIGKVWHRINFFD